MLREILLRQILPRAAVAQRESIVRTFARLALLACVVLIHPAYAAPISNPPQLTLADALRAAAEHNPELRGQVFDLRALEGRKQQAGARPNPELALEMENLAGSGQYAGTDALETTLALSQVIELGGKRSARVAIVESQLDATQAEHAIRRLDVQAEVTRRFIRLVADQEQFALARRTTSTAQDFLAGISARVQAARSPKAEESRAQIALARARLEEARAERKLLTSRHSLAATWGASEPGFEAAYADLHYLPEVGDFEGLVGRLAANPALTRYVSQQRLRESELQLARATRTPDISLGAGVRRFEQDGDYALVLSFALPLRVANRNQGANAESQARLDKAPLEREAAVLEARTRLFELYQELDQAKAEALALQADIIPQAEEALKQTEYGYERGRFSYLEVSEARRELILARHSHIEAAASYHLLIAEIERLTSEPVTALK
jgi:cobalt-zinc-cadmium efflux system outer membrane protein